MQLLHSSSLDTHKKNCQCHPCKHKRGEKTFHKKDCQCWPCKHRRGEKTPHKKDCSCCMCNSVSGKLHNRYGTHHTEEAKQLNREKHLGKHPSAETIRKRIISLRKPREIRTCIGGCGLNKEVLLKSDWKICFKCSHAIIARKMGRRNRGKNHGCWKGGISHRRYSFSFNSQIKERVRVRDNFRCKICSVPELELLRRLHVHHIDYNKKNTNINNLISLCHKCHMKTNMNRKYWILYFKEHRYETSNITI
jgi:hypothetical protein